MIKGLKWTTTVSLYSLNNCVPAKQDTTKKKDTDYWFLIGVPQKSVL